MPRDHPAVEQSPVWNGELEQPDETQLLISNCLMRRHRVRRFLGESSSGSEGTNSYNVTCQFP